MPYCKTENLEKGDQKLVEVLPPFRTALIINQLYIYLYTIHNSLIIKQQFLK